MSSIRCFIIERTGKSQYRLRRFSEGPGCGDRGYHNALTAEPVAETDDDLNKTWLCTNPPEVPREDPRWPKKCQDCEYIFTEKDHWQVWGDPVYRRTDTGELVLRRCAPPGSLWRASWYENDGEVCPGWTGPDGEAWEVTLPDGTHWFIDGKCSNCTRPNEPHYCWYRTGKAPDFTVGKGGNTCNVGAGSILTKGYHGFLRNGFLESC